MGININTGVFNTLKNSLYRMETGIFTVLYLSMNNIISLTDDFSLINRILSQVPGFITFQDLHGRYLCANNLTINLLGFDHLKEVVGLYVGEIRCPAAQLEAQIDQLSKYVVEHNHPINVLFSAYVTNNHWGLFLGQLQPLKDHTGSTIGISTHTHEITHSHLPGALFQLFLEREGEGKMKMNQGVYQYLDTQREWELSPRQGECLFWVLQRKSAMEIGQLLGLSKRTVEYYIDLIKGKFQVKNLSELLDLGYEKGLYNFIPNHWCIP